ncbi:MAG: sensor histidine kinase [Eubacterium sp.]|nr:sensor histidine kinase [Eubacterium sp.]
MSDNKRIIEAIAVLLLCLMGISLSDDFVMPVIVFLIATGAASITQITANKYISYAIIILMSLLCGWIPLLFNMLPLLVYVALDKKKWYLTLPSLLTFRNTGADFFSGDSFFSAYIGPSLVPAQYMFAILGSIVATIIYIRVSGTSENNQKLRSLRDKIAGINEQLYEKNARLVEAQDHEIELATLNERNRIAREIHDNVGHMLTRSILQAGALEIANKDENLKEPISELKATLNLAMDNVRASVHDLHDESINLKAVIEESVVPAREHFFVTVDYGLDTDIPGYIKTGFAGIIKESVSNAIRHSDGDRLNICLKELPGSYSLEVSDNGSPAEISHTGIGLDNMRERTREMKGRIRFDSTDRGFMVSVTVPR